METKLNKYNHLLIDLRAEADFSPSRFRSQTDNLYTQLCYFDSGRHNTYTTYRAICSKKGKESKSRCFKITTIIYEDQARRPVQFSNKKSKIRKGKTNTSSSSSTSSNDSTDDSDSDGSSSTGSEKERKQKKTLSSEKKNNGIGGGAERHFPCACRHSIPTRESGGGNYARTTGENIDGAPPPPDREIIEVVAPGPHISEVMMGIENYAEQVNQLEDSSVVDIRNQADYHLRIFVGDSTDPDVVATNEAPKIPTTKERVIGILTNPARQVKKAIERREIFMLCFLVAKDLNWRTVVETMHLSN